MPLRCRWPTPGRGSLPMTCNAYSIASTAPTPYVPAALEESGWGLPSHAGSSKPTAGPSTPIVWWDRAAGSSPGGR